MPILAVIATTCAFSLGQVAVGFAQQAGEITIDDPRPLAAIAREVEKRCGCAVTYSVDDGHLQHQTPCW
jgi:hypothetical protein